MAGQNYIYPSQAASANPSVGVTGSAAPVDATEVGGVDGTGKLQALVMTANGLKTDGSAVTQPVSGTVTANAGTGTFTVGQATGTNLHTVVDSGTITANIGTTNGLALDATVSQVQGSVTGGAAATKSDLIGGQYNTALPTLTNAQQSAIQLDSSGRVIVAQATSSALNATVVQGTAANLNATIVQSTASNLNAQVQGPAASGASKSGNPVQTGGVFNTTQPTVTTGQVVEAQATARGAQIVATGVDTFNVTVNAALPAGSNAIGGVTQSGNWSTRTQDGSGNSITSTSNALDINVKSGTVAATQSGTWTVQPGNTANTTAWLVNTGSKTAKNHARNSYVSTNVTTGAYVQLLASTSAAVSEIEIFDSSGQTLVLATGGVGAEVDQIYIIPGGNGRVPLSIAASTRVAIKAVTATASTGEIDINFYG